MRFFLVFFLSFSVFANTTNTLISSLQNGDTSLLLHSTTNDFLKKLINTTANGVNNGNSPIKNIEADFRLDKDNNLTGSASALVSIAQSESSLLFAELRYSNNQYGNDSTRRDLFNTGLTFRKKIKDDSLLGLNIFHDFTKNHRRASLGFDYRKSAWQVSSNFYLPLSSWYTIARTENSYTQEKVMKGLDFNLSGFFLSKKNLNVVLSAYKFFSDETSINDISGYKSSIVYRPIPLLGLYYTYDKPESMPEIHSFGTKLNYWIGESFKSQLRSKNTKKLFTDMDVLMFERTQRENFMRFEERTVTLESDATNDGQSTVSKALSASLSSEDMLVDDHGYNETLRIEIDDSPTQDVTINITPSNDSALTEVTSVTFAADAVQLSQEIMIESPGSAGTVTFDFDVVTDDPQYKDFVMDSVSIDVYDEGQLSPHAIHGSSSSDSLSNMFDNTDTVWSSETGDEWVQIDFASPKRLTLLFVLSEGEYHPESVNVQGSNDGSSWSNIDYDGQSQISNDTYTYNDPFKFSSDHKNKYQYYKVLMSSSKDHIDVTSLVIQGY